MRMHGTNATQDKLFNTRTTLSPRCQKLEVYDFEVFFTVAEAGSFRKASEFLRIEQSAITRRIQKLEEALGVSLFERRRTGAHLTTAGWGFLTSGRSLIGEIRAAIAAAQVAGTGGNGSLRIGLIASLSRGELRNLISAFIEKLPLVELSFTESERGELLTLLSHRMLDVVIASGTPSSEHGNMLLFSNEPLYIALPDNHPLADREHISRTSLAPRLAIFSSEKSATSGAPPMPDTIGSPGKAS
jgi:DNA-binding transcriptional LysR family regulator